MKLTTDQKKEILDQQSQQTTTKRVTAPERVDGTEVSAKGKLIIQKLIKGEEVKLEGSGLSKREWNELMATFNMKDKLA